MCAKAVGSVSVKMGDDCLEWSKFLKHQDLVNAYKSINLPVRDVEVQEGGDFLFCSHRFKRQTDGSWVCWLETWQRMLYESSFSRLNDESTNLNYLAEIESMPDSPEKERISRYLSCRKMVLGSVAGHEEQEFTNEESFDSF